MGPSQLDLLLPLEAQDRIGLVTSDGQVAFGDSNSAPFLCAGCQHPAETRKHA